MCAHRLRVQLGEVVDVFAGVLAARDAEAEVKVEGLEVPRVPEEVTLDHPEVLHSFVVAHGEFDGGANRSEVQELGGELITHEATDVGIVRVCDRPWRGDGNEKLSQYTHSR